MPSYESGLTLELGSAGGPRTEAGAAAPPAAECADPVLFTRMVREHSRYVLGLLPKLGVAPDDAPDVAQEVYLAAHKQLPRFEGRSTLKTWLSGICQHKAADHRRKFIRREVKRRAQPIDLPEPPYDPCDTLIQHELAEKLQQVLLELPADQREVFVLCEVEGLSMPDVAAMVGCPLNTAYSRHRAARLKLQVAMRRTTLRDEGP
jgi:RNA polymerase sigma-70 factor, ECF subfamily